MERVKYFRSFSKGIQAFFRGFCLLRLLSLRAAKKPLQYPALSIAYIPYDKVYTEIICKKFCKYYKEGKEELYCGGYEFLRNNLTPHELKAIAGSLKCGDEIKSSISSRNKSLTELVCRKCDFFTDGCDFTESRSRPPCGGYIFISKTFSRRAG